MSLFVLIMLKREREALRLPKAGVVKEPRIKGQFYNNTTFRSEASVTASACNHGIFTLTVNYE